MISSVERYGEILHVELYTGYLKERRRKSFLRRKFVKISPLKATDGWSDTER